MLRILGLEFDAKVLVELKRLFIDDRFVNSWHFTPLQRCLFGYDKVPLDIMLDQVDARDGLGTTLHGRTPLDWAAQRGDLSSVLALLSHGAHSREALYWTAASATSSPIIVDILEAIVNSVPDFDYDQDILARALATALSTSKPLNFVSILLRLGSDPNAELEVGTSLHYARFKDQVAATKILSMLAEYGADLNASVKHTVDQDTPLHSMMFMNPPMSLSVTKAFIEAGADPCRTDRKGHTPAIRAIVYDSVEVACYLIRYVLDLPRWTKSQRSEIALDMYQAIIDLNRTSIFLCMLQEQQHFLFSSGGKTILHVLAKDADGEILNPIPISQLAAIDPEQRLEEEPWSTALELAISSKRPQTFIEAFKDLIEQIKAYRESESFQALRIDGVTSSEAENQEEDLEDFHDALEA